jgi:hypothetical protein
LDSPGEDDDADVMRRFTPTLMRKQWFLNAIAGFFLYNCPKTDRRDYTDQFLWIDSRVNAFG